MKYLVVDDEPTILILIKRYLRHKGHEVITANNARSGFELALAEQPMVIITDYDLPDENGVAMLQRIYATHGLVPPPRYILMSGLGQPLFETLQQNGQADLVALFLPKPFNIEQLNKAILPTL